MSVDTNAFGLAVDSVGSDSWLIGQVAEIERSVRVCDRSGETGVAFELNSPEQETFMNTILGVAPLPELLTMEQERFEILESAFSGLFDSVHVNVAARDTPVLNMYAGMVVFHFLDRLRVLVREFGWLD